MLNRKRVIDALEASRDAFQRYGEEQQKQQRMVGTWRSIFDELSSDQILAKLAGNPWPGALPTPELDTADGLCLPFGVSWSDHQEARAWAKLTLENRPTIAVDGSQITPDPMYAIPVGAIQIGWFINPHCGEQPYVKDIDFAVLPPETLREADNEAESFAVQIVNQKRFEAECRRLTWLMRSAAEEPLPARGMPPLSFFDGSFIISFAGKIREGRAQPYIHSVHAMLETSRQYQMPIVGFVDTSHSHDIATMVRSMQSVQNDLPEVSDAALLSSILHQWGDRTPFFICARPDALSRNQSDIFYKDVAFCYIRLNQHRPPARLEIPRWLLESGQAEDVVNLVRAECVVGAGYPYAIETADALAVISYPDRQRFYRIFGQFIEREGLALTVSQKMLSKQNRR